MKINLNPLDQVVKKAERRINIHRCVSLQDLAHDRKRQMAAAGPPWSSEFVAAATLEGIAADALARVILSKPDVMMIAENERRALILQIRAAKTAAEVAALMVNVPDYPADHLHEII